MMKVGARLNVLKFWNLGLNKSEKYVDRWQYADKKYEKVNKALDSNLKTYIVWLSFKQTPWRINRQILTLL